MEHEKIDVNKRDVDGASALMFSAMRGHLVRALISLTICVVVTVIFTGCGGVPD